MKKKFVIFFILIVINLFNCDTSSSGNEIHNNIVDEIESKCCVNSTNQRIIVEFTSNIVQHEYIIQFKNYYREDSRRNFINSALDNTEVKSQTYQTDKK